MKILKWFKHAIQRITKGYSYQDVYDIGGWFLNVVPQMLMDMANIENLPVPISMIEKAKKMNPNLSEKEIEELELDVKLWKETLREIAYYLSEGYDPKDEINEYSGDVKFEWLEGRELTKEEEELQKKFLEREQEIAEYSQKQLQKGLKMFSENINMLWW